MISDRIRKNIAAGFRLGSGLAGDSKPIEARSSLAQLDGPVHGLSAGGLQGGSCQRQGAGKGVFYARLPLVSLVNFSAK